MKKFVIVLFCYYVAFTVWRRGKNIKIGLDADPVSLDTQVQLSGGMLQYSHLVFDPLIRWTQEMTFEPRLANQVGTS